MSDPHQSTGVIASGEKQEVDFLEKRKRDFAGPGQPHSAQVWSPSSLDSYVLV